MTTSSFLIEIWEGQRIAGSASVDTNLVCTKFQNSVESMYFCNGLVARIGLILEVCKKMRPAQADRQASKEPE